MHFSVSLLTLALVATDAVTAGAIPKTHVLHEKRSHFPGSGGLIKRSRVNARAALPMRVALKQRNIGRGHDWLMDVSQPDSANYGKYWSSHDVVRAFAPTDETVKAVKDWLVNVGGIKDYRITHADNKQWLAFDATTDEAEKLLHTTFHEYEQGSTGTKYIACDEYHVPAAVQSHIDYITPGVKGVKTARGMTKRAIQKRAHANTVGGGHAPIFRKEAALPANATSLATCDEAITPACLRALYDFKAPSPTAKVNPNNSLGIFEEGDYYAAQDLDNFFSIYAKQIPQGTQPVLDSVDGGEAPVPVPDAGGESDLDFELAYPIIYPQTVTLYQTDDSFYAQGGNGTDPGIFNTFLDAIDGSYCTYCAFGECGNAPGYDPVYPDPAPGGFKGQLECGIFKPTNVISISYGEQEQDLPAFYQQRQCNEFLKLGLQGTSIFVASGDTGVGGLRGDGSPNGCLGPNATIFSPTQPNSCPYLTNVGATEVPPNSTVFQPEVAANEPSERYSSGGGFSNIFPAPDYQQAAIATYFATSNPPYPYYFDGQYNSSGGGLYNRNGRGIPDVAANGLNIATFVQGNATLEGGTSASSPIFASLINRIVEDRLAAGKGPLGFINPTLYKNPQVLNDIVAGNNPGCGTQGFSASKGWDPVTGLGTPNFPKMRDLFLGLP